MSCSPISTRPLGPSSAVTDTTRGSSSYQVSVAASRGRRPGCHRARPQSRALCARASGLQPIGGGSTCAVSSGDHSAGGTVGGTVTVGDGWSAGVALSSRNGRSMRIESSTSAAKSAEAPDDGSGHGVVLMTTIVPSMSMTHTVSIWPGSYGPLPKPICFGHHPAPKTGCDDPPVRTLGDQPRCRSPTCRQARCAGTLCQRSRRWRCPSGRSRRPIPSAR